MFPRIIKFIPDPLKITIKKLWRKVRPQRIKLTKFVEKGCSFEITTKLEEYRVASFGDEVASIQRVLSEIKSNDIFYDIGSCVGIYALHAALLGAIVVGFEPDPSFRKRLVKNIQINKLQKKIQVIDWAVSDKEDMITLYTDGVNGNSPSLRLVGERGVVTVKTNTIDNAVASKQIPYPDVVKMDIEGAEILALKGMEKTLMSDKAPRFLFIEFHPNFLPSFNSSVEKCEKLIEACGYTRSNYSERSGQLHYFYKKIIK